MRRIALISEHASPLCALGGVDAGGQNVYVAEIARFLSRAGHHVDVFTRRDSEKLPDVIEWMDGVRVVHVAAGPKSFVRKEDMLPHMAQFTHGVLEFCRRYGEYDVIHANFWMSGLVAADVKRVLGTPFVITFHALGRVRREFQQGADEFPDERFAIEDRIAAEADGIVAECPQDEQDLIELYDADPAKIRIVPCGFDPDELWPVDKAEARAYLGLSQDQPLVLQLGRMVPRKGVETVVRAFSKLLAEHDLPAKLLVVGGESEDPDPAATPEIARLQQIAFEEGVSEAVLFAGRRSREELRYFYSAADIFVTTPWYEPFGITPLEAMACGTPVIGSAVGGVKYTVRHGETGYLVPSRDPACLASALASLLSDNERLTRFGEQSLRWVNERFTWSRVGGMIGELYEAVIGPPLAGTDEARELLEIEDVFNESIEVLTTSRSLMARRIQQAGEVLASCFQSGGSVLVCGNGGSATDAQHFAAELVGRFSLPGRGALPVVALTADTAILTAWANDVGYEHAFARQVEALGRAGDIIVGVSTSGRSGNVIEAFRAARRKGMTCIALLGADGGPLMRLADLPMVAPAQVTPRIQEVHTLVLHLLAKLVEERIVIGGAPRLRVVGQEGDRGDASQGWTEQSPWAA